MKPFLSQPFKESKKGFVPAGPPLKLFTEKVSSKGGNSDGSVDI
jgi:hypothetical protein